MNNRIRPFVRLLLLALVFGTLVSAIGVQAQDEQIVASDDRAVSIHLPPGWTFRSMGENTVYSSSLVAAEDAAVLDGAINYYLLGNGAVPGDFIILAVVDPSFWSLFNPNPEQALLSVLGALLQDPSAPWTVNDQFQYALGNTYNAVVADVSSSTRNIRGYVGGFVAGNDVVVFALNVNPLRDFDAERPLLENIAETIRVPAESGALTAINILETPEQSSIDQLPTRVPPTAAAATQAAPPSQPDNEIITIPSDENILSISIPADWLVLDHAVDLGTYAFGDSEDAVRSRFGTIYPEALSSPIPLSGVGGLVILYSMAEYGVDPDDPNLYPLMNGLLERLESSGYEVVKRTTPLDGSNPVNGIYVVVRGAEYGYIALVPFGDQVVYISATGMRDSFEPNSDLLMSILRSVRVPADTGQPAEEATPSMGLGGLGGARTATPTVEPTQGGLGGLFGNPIMTATPTP